MLTVVVPIYGVEKYIERCARSLFEQTLSDIEYIFIDDCSPDKSVDVFKNVLNEYPLRANRVKLIRNQTNKGIAEVRKIGITSASGDYIGWCDSDDWIDADMFKTLYETAINADADIVTCKFMSEYGTTSKKNKAVSGQCYTGNAIDAFKSLKFTASLCDKIIRTEILQKHNIYPYEGHNYGEDFMVVVRTLMHSRKIIGINTPYYHYNRVNPNSCCQGDFISHLTQDMMPQLKMLEEYTHHNFGTKFDTTLDHLKFVLKEKLITSPRDLKTWCALWPECHRSILSLPLGYNRWFLWSLRLCSWSPMLMSGLFGAVDKYSNMR